MRMVRCDNGHFYEDAKHTTCPHCGIPGLDLGGTKPVPGLGADPGGDDTEPMALRDERPARGSGDGETEAAGGAGRRPAGGDKPTVGVVPRKLGFDPVVGWLVCIDGPDRGRDFRIRAERNFIGRASSMDISIPGDDAISREKHAVLSFDPKKRAFRLAAGDGRGLVYLNDTVVDVAASLAHGDIIELGKTRLMFVPLCGESFAWDPVPAGGAEGAAEDGDPA